MNRSATPRPHPRGPALPAVACALLVCAIAVAGEPLRVIIPGLEAKPGMEAKTDVRQDYFVELLRLALEKSADSDGPFVLQTCNLEMQFQDRGLRLLQRGEVINLAWTMTSIEREQQLLPIRIPLLKGLLGYRIFIIREADQDKFAAVRSLDDLKRFTAGQGLRWPDTEILRANGLDVLVGSSYDGLFAMLRKHRFDYFPRGITEAWKELEAHSGQGLAVENTLLLHYPTAIYYFVNKNDTNLAARIERGLRRAIEDGSFESLFQHYNARWIEGTDMKQRRIFELENPLLPAETPLAETGLWFHP
jgi:ABC-type amino acid transport substrate-binding protein